jgi:hypothetical protein
VYLTAHLVRSRDGEEGINAFLHLHGTGFAWPADPTALADSNPGKIELRRTSLPPGGNDVRAYLDVLAPDGTPKREFDEALAALASDLDERRNPTVFRHGRVVIRFGVELALEGLRAQQLDMLRPTIGWLLDDHHALAR